jgi:hypothetical protein
MTIASSIRNILKTYSVSFKENGQSIICDCPRCAHSEKLYFRKTNGRFICFYCASSEGYSGSPEIALSDITGLPIDEIKALLIGESYTDPLFEEAVGSEIVVQAFPDTVIGPESSKFAPGMHYLSSRGVTPQLVDFYGLKFDFRSRSIIFPLYRNGLLLGWTTRSILTDKQRTYVNNMGEIKTIPKSLHNFPKANYLLWEDKWPDVDYLILTEGPISCIKTFLCKGGVASLGKIVSNKQISIIKHKKIKKLYLGLDPDAGQEIENLIKKMYGYGFDIFLLMPPKGKSDLGDCTLEEVYEQFMAASIKLTPSHIIMV